MNKTSQRRYTNGQCTQKMFNITNPQGNVNVIAVITTLQSLEGLQLKRFSISNVGKNVEQLKLLHIASGHAKWYSHISSLGVSNKVQNNLIRYLLKEIKV